MFHLPTRRLGLLALPVLAGLTLMSGCSDASVEDDADAAASGAASNGAEDGSAEEQWPRTFTNSDDTTTEIPAEPHKIVSTSVSVSGTLLAFDAPIVASGSAGNGEFFAQWDEIAKERDVGNLWAAGEVDLEAIYAHDPDLIVVSASGADSVVDQVSELEEIAPTIVVDYGGQTWQELAIELGEATGLEDQAAKSVEEFDAYVSEAAEKVAVPEGEANIVSYNGPGEANPIARAGSAQAELLADLGFTIEDPPLEWHTQGEERADFVWANYDHLTELTAETTFILSQDNEGAQEFAKDPVLATLPSVEADQVYGLGLNSFRVDRYSATEIVDGVLDNFGN